MKLMNRNKQVLYYCPFLKSEPLMTVEGYDTGEEIVVYGDAVKLRCSISVDKGTAQSEVFGIDADYDRVVITDDMQCLMDEQSVLFVDMEPTYENGIPKFNYVVKKRAVGLNEILFAISKVNT